MLGHLATSFANVLDKNEVAPREGGAEKQEASLPVFRIAGQGIAVIDNARDEFGGAGKTPALFADERALYAVIDQGVEKIFVRRGLKGP